MGGLCGVRTRVLLCVCVRWTFTFIQGGPDYVPLLVEECHLFHREPHDLTAAFSSPYQQHARPREDLQTAALDGGIWVTDPETYVYLVEQYLRRLVGHSLLQERRLRCGAVLISRYVFALCLQPVVLIVVIVLFVAQPPTLHVLN